MSTKTIAKWGCLPIALLVGIAIAIGGGEDDTAKSSAPPAARKSAPEPVSDLPPKPDLTTRTAYIADLDAIDPDIVHGKDDKAVSRGLNQCSSFKTTIDGKKLSRQKLVNYTNYRFTSPNHPNGHGTEIAERILDVVHKHLCPSY
ncbi:hypothetical protein [Streptomyces werraensis]|uniref:hypothetical protein n=1 Tax=Streptomyces werraensis TaxID=68284 RepID=UPI0036D01121